MAMVVPQPESITFDEFLLREHESSERHELIDGWIIAMAGGTLAHNLVTQAAVAAIRPAARSHDCRVYASDALLRVGDNDGFYPDVMVVCEDGLNERFETSPCLIIEVLSLSTHQFDRHAKRAAYSRIPALLHYLLVSPDTFSVEAYHRVGQRWSRTRYELGDRITLACPTLTFAIDELFEDLTGETSEF